ncbi:MAG TPA: hypothetical protein VJT16_01795 [Streptosporangiaceae bacterium]|nr:hypothetical protein [Streptosporangiaceae bacterium]
MARVAVIGEPLQIHRYGLSGAMLCPATDQAEAILAWREMPDDIEVAVLTPSAARWLAIEIARRPGVLPVLLPETVRAGESAWPDYLPDPDVLGCDAGLPPDPLQR